MRRALVVLALFVSACGSDTPSGPIIASVPPTPVPVATATPTPATIPAPSVGAGWIGFWKSVNTDNLNDFFDGYGITIDSYKPGDPDEIRGRSVYSREGLTGLLIGTVKKNGRVEWRTQYANGTESGSFDMEGVDRMRGTVYFEVNGFRYRYTNILLVLQ